MELLQKELTDSVIKVFYDVYNEPGYGFWEKVYQNAMFIELSSRGFHVEVQKQIKVYYKNREVGVCYSDIIVNDLVIIRTKSG